MTKKEILEQAEEKLRQAWKELNRKGKDLTWIRWQIADALALLDKAMEDNG